MTAEEKQGIKRILEGRELVSDVVSDDESVGSNESDEDSFATLVNEVVSDHSKSDDSESSSDEEGEVDGGSGGIKNGILEGIREDSDAEDKNEQEESESESEQEMSKQDKSEQEDDDNDSSEAEGGFESPSEASDEESLADDFETNNEMIPAVDVGNAGLELADEDVLSHIQLLQTKKKRIDEDDNFEKALHEAEARRSLRVFDLEVLIISRGGVPPPSGRGQRKAFLSAWDALKAQPVTWERIETWTDSEQNRLEELQKLLKCDDTEEDSS
jgi:hypothetical protein